MSDYELAHMVAQKFHAGQKYGKDSYMVHLEAVANSLKSQADDRLPVIGILHDILEDTSCSQDVLFSLFEDNVVKAVVALTKVEGEAYDHYISRVKANQLAKTVKMHDTLCNLSESLKRLDMKRVIKYSKQMQLLGE